MLLGARSAGSTELNVYAAEPPLPAPSPPAGVAPDTVATYIALADRVERLDGTFQRERDALNAEARAMRSEDRRAPSYERRYHAFEERRRGALALRHARDSLRARAGSLLRRHPALAALGAAANGTPRDTLTPRTRISSPGDTVRLTLPAGTWWIQLRDDLPARKLEVTTGAADTVRLR